MVDSPPTNLRSLDARLRNHCEAVGRDVSRARRHVGALVVANLLHGTDTVVKGGRNLEIRAPVPPDYRPHRVEVKLDFEGRGFGTVLLEAAIEEAGGLQATGSIASADGAAIVEAVGLPAPGPR